MASGCRASGRPERWLVTMGDEPGSSVAFATNSSAISATPARTKNLKIGIAALQPQNSTCRATPGSQKSKKGTNADDHFRFLELGSNFNFTAIHSPTVSALWGSDVLVRIRLGADAFQVRQSVARV